MAGQVKITGGAPGANKVLTSDASGLASWQTGGGPVSTGLYGWCFTSPTTGFCQARPPALCGVTPYNCGCQAGYTLVQTGAEGSESLPPNYQWWFSCYKN